MFSYGKSHEMNALLFCWGTHEGGQKKSHIRKEGVHLGSFPPEPQESLHNMDAVHGRHERYLMKSENNRMWIMPFESLKAWFLVTRVVTT